MQRMGVVRRDRMGQIGDNSPFEIGVPTFRAVWETGAIVETRGLKGWPDLTVGRVLGERRTERDVMRNVQKDGVDYGQWIVLLDGQDEVYAPGEALFRHTCTSDKCPPVHPCAVKK